MAIGTPWIGTAVQGNVAGSNVLTVTVDVSGATNGEVVFIIGTMSDAQTGVLNTPTNWAKAGELSEGTSGGSSSRTIVYSKVKNSGDTTVIITGAGWTATAKPQFVGISWPGVDTVTPFEQFTWGVAHTSGASYVTGTATPTAANRWAVGIFSSRGSTATVAWTPDAALTERVDLINSSSIFTGLEIADSNGAVTQAAHSYTATGQTASHGLAAVFYLIPAVLVQNPVDTTGLTDAAVLEGVVTITADFNSGSDTATITASPPIAAVTGTPTFTSDSKHGALGMAVGFGAPTNASTFVRIDATTVWPKRSLSYYHRPKSQSASFTTVIRFADTASNPVFSVCQTTTKFDLRDEAGTTIASSTLNWADQWYRWDFQLDLTTPTAPAITWRIFATPEAAVPTETITQTLTATRTFARYLVGAVGVGGSSSTRETRGDTFRAGDGLFWIGPFGSGDVALTPVDPSGLTDAAVLDRVQSSVDPLGLADSAVIALGVNQAPIDALGLTDSATLARGIGQPAIDPLGLTDATALSFGPAVADPLGLTDQATLALGVNTAVSDSMGLTDSVQITAGGTVSPIDPMGLTDAAALARVTISVDSENLTDVATVAVGNNRTQADPLTLTDTAALAVSRSQVITDTAGMVDAVFIELVRNTALSDSIGMTDAVMISLELAILDEMALSDTVTGLPTIPDRDLDLQGSLLASRFTGEVAPGRFVETIEISRLVAGISPSRLVGTIEPGRLTGEVEWR